MKKVTIDSNSILDASTKKTMPQVFDFNKEYVTTETDKDTTYKAGEGISIASDNTISIASVEDGDEPTIEQADSTTAGIMKLYSETGSNSDGTMTQESITDELSSKASTDSPTFTGTPTAPTPSSSDTGSDRIATTAYVLNLLKNEPGIIDEILTALGDKADKTAGNSSTLGLTKLYTGTGSNTDGTMTQKAISEKYFTADELGGMFFSSARMNNWASNYPGTYEGFYLGDGIYAGNPNSNYAGLKYVSNGIGLIGYQARSKTEKAAIIVEGTGKIGMKGEINVDGCFMNQIKIAFPSGYHIVIDYNGIKRYDSSGTLVDSKGW